MKRENKHMSQQIHKTYNKNLIKFMIKLSKLSIAGNFLNLIISSYQKPTADIIHNGEALEVFLLK